MPVHHPAQLRGFSAFELVEYDVGDQFFIYNDYNIEKRQEVVLLDADMIVMANMDELFELQLPKDWIAAAHICACNPRKLLHYPSDWLAASFAIRPFDHIQQDTC